MNLKGIFPALTTPFAADGSVAIEKLKSNVGRYNSTQVAGYVAVGSTGESVLLSVDEVDRVWVAVREAAAPGKTLIAGTGVDSTAQTIARTRRAAEVGYDAALVKTPYYFKSLMTPQALDDHYRRVADASPIPVMIYAVPQYTGVPVTAGLVAKLAEHPNIVGLKESSGNVQLCSEIVSAVPRDFRVLAGAGSVLFPSLATGASGGIQAMACFLPELCVAMYQAAIARDMELAARLQHSALQCSRAIVGELGPPGVKAAMDCVGYYGGPPRPPLLPVTAAQLRSIEFALAAALPAGAAAHAPAP